MMLRDPGEVVLPENQQPLLAPASPPQAEPVSMEKLIAIGKNGQSFFCNRQGEPSPDTVIPVAGPGAGSSSARPVPGAL